MKRVSVVLGMIVMLAACAPGTQVHVNRGGYHVKTPPPSAHSGYKCPPGHHMKGEC